MDVSLLNEIMDESVKTPEVKLNCDDDFLSEFELILFSDGACSGNGKKNSNAGFGVYIHIHGNNKHPLQSTKIMRRLETVRYFKYDTGASILRSNVNTIKGGEAGELSDLPLCSHDNCDNIGYAGVTGKSELFCSSHKKQSHIVKYRYMTFSATNNRGEGIGILTCLRIILAHVKGSTGRKQIWEHIKDYPKDCFTLKTIDSRTIFDSYGSVETKKHKYMIVSDSKLWINIVCNWMNGWIINGIIMEKKNIDIVIWINNVLSELEKEDVSILIQHVPGHFDSKSKNTNGEALNIYHRGNIVVDKLATHSTKLGNTKLAMV